MTLRLSWSADLTPGDWVVIVSLSQLVKMEAGIGYLDATVLDGGELDLIMTSGGLLKVQLFGRYRVTKSSCRKFRLRICHD